RCARAGPRRRRAATARRRAAAALGPRRPRADSRENRAERRRIAVGTLTQACAGPVDSATGVVANSRPPLHGAARRADRPWVAQPYRRLLGSGYRPRAR